MITPKLELTFDQDESATEGMWLNSFLAESELYDALRDFSDIAERAERAGGETFECQTALGNLRDILACREQEAA